MGFGVEFFLLLLLRSTLGFIQIALRIIMSAGLAQEVTVPTTTKPAPLYPFLSQPPPQKKHPTQPLPSPPSQTLATSVRPPVGRRRSATIAAVSAWIAEVHPGSPAPYSPRRSPSIRRLSLSRRPSVALSRVPSASFISFSETPASVGKAHNITPSIADFQPDLSALGYTSVFVRFPNTPMSPDMTSKHDPSRLASPALPLTPAKEPRRGLKQFKSLTSLKSARRARSRGPPSPPYSPAKAFSEARRSRALSNAAVTKNKESKYTNYRPAPLTNELALAQLLDGGYLDDHVKRYAELQAKAAGAVKIDGQLVGVGDVWRDGESGIWRDQDEEWEFAHLLGGEEDFCAGDAQWVQFNSPKLAEVERRESLSTQDSDLSARYAMNADTDSHDDLAVFGGDLLPTTLIKPGMSVLAIPSRSRRTAKHLRKPEFLLDVFPVPRSPTYNATGQRSPLSPRIVAFHAGAAARPKGKARRRPTPLALVPHSPAVKRPTNPDTDPEQMRHEFLTDSFTPRPRNRASRQLPSQRHGMVVFDGATRKLAMAKPSILNMKGLFKAMGSKKASHPA